MTVIKRSTEKRNLRIIDLFKRKGGGGGGRGGGGGGGRGGGSGSGRGSGTGTTSTTRTGTGPGTTGSRLGGSGGTGRSPISSVPSFGVGKQADYFSRGGGSSFTLGSSSPFAGRLAGGGTREMVVGTPRYGSGYPYGYTSGSSYRTGTVGMPFPFGFWPVYYPHYGHSHQYNNTVEDKRPGGQLVQAAFQPNATQWYISQEAANNETYWLLGDRESVSAMLQILSGCKDCETYSCGISNVTEIVPMTMDLVDFSANSTNTNTTIRSNSSTTPPQVQNVVQYYRASSFALAYTNYTNMYSIAPLNETTDVFWENSTPLPTLLKNSAFMQCVNNTLVAGLPILNAAGRTKVAGFQLTAVISAAVGAILFSGWL
ncbi:hypothetical protein CPB86DRAFT_786208 [Serendipita vermifera]|nr:hypothetical protein CPB86DRAFT_786208 [Serendipita vermifera]